MFRILTFILFFVSVSVSAQRISPLTINSGGNVGKNLDYSIGESSSITYFQLVNKSSLNTGFMQSFTPLVTGIVNQVFEVGEQWILSPNPASKFIRIKGGLSKPGFIEFHLVDFQGHILETIPSAYSINYLEKEINVSQLVEGTYFVRLIYSSFDGINQSTSFKFIKIN
jgi:hypothetical protein